MIVSKGEIDEEFVQSMREIISLEQINLINKNIAEGINGVE